MYIFIAESTYFCLQPDESYLYACCSSSKMYLLMTVAVLQKLHLYLHVLRAVSLGTALLILRDIWFI